MKADLAYDTDENNLNLPKNHVKNCIVYTARMIPTP
jgi:hypothetical protein